MKSVSDANIQDVVGDKEITREILQGQFFFSARHAPEKEPRANCSRLAETFRMFRPARFSGLVASTTSTAQKTARNGLNILGFHLPVF